MLATVWRATRAVVAVALTLVALVLPVRAWHVNQDADHDGLSDCRERSGLRTVGGAASYVTDPSSADTDGDLVPDAVEIGRRAGPGNLADAMRLLWDCRSQTYRAISDPSRPDSDFDGLSDAVEISDGSDVFALDSDGDGLRDDAERTWSSDPNGTDTDGDGIPDVEDVSDGLSPVVEDVVEDSRSWQREYAEGLYFGDVRESDSVAQLLGSLTGGASSTVPYIGWVTGTAADARDIAANAAHGDWGEAGMSGAGLVPYVGDAAKAASKTARFVAKHPELVGGLTRRLATWEKIPEGVRMKLLGATDKRSYDTLVESRLSDDRIVALVSRGARLAALAKLINHAAGTVAVSSGARVGENGFFATMSDAEEELRSSVAGGDDAAVGGPAYVSVGQSSEGRLFDVCTNCRATPSPASSTLYVTRLGTQVWSETIRDQIEKDAALARSGYDVEWHFFAGPTGLDVDPEIVEALAAARIPYVVHL